MGGGDSRLATNSASAGKGESVVVISGTSTSKYIPGPKLELLIGSYQKGYHKKLDKD